MEKERKRNKAPKGPWLRVYAENAVHQLFIVAPVYALFVICLVGWLGLTASPRRCTRTSTRVPYLPSRHALHSRSFAEMSQIRIIGRLIRCIFIPVDERATPPIE